MKPRPKHDPAHRAWLTAHRRRRAAWAEHRRHLLQRIEATCPRFDKPAPKPAPEADEDEEGGWML